MQSLHDLQTCFAVTLRDGPAALNPDFYSGELDDVLLGFTVHANTVSHARLVALEDTFPNTRQILGEARFNALSRDWLDEGNGHDQALATLGSDFPNWLEQAGLGEKAVSSARLEWDWLQSFHARDAASVHLGDFAQLDAEDLLAVRLTHHPAARIVNRHQLVTRPNLTVSVELLTATEVLIFESFESGASTAEALSSALAGPEEPQAALAFNRLVSLGALMFDEGTST